MRTIRPPWHELLVHELRYAAGKAGDVYAWEFNRAEKGKCRPSDLLNAWVYLHFRYDDFDFDNAQRRWADTPAGTRRVVEEALGVRIWEVTEATKPLLLGSLEVCFDTAVAYAREALLWRLRYGQLLGNLSLGLLGIPKDLHCPADEDLVMDARGGHLRLGRAVEAWRDDDSWEVVCDWLEAHGRPIRSQPEAVIVALYEARYAAQANRGYDDITTNSVDTFVNTASALVEVDFNLGTVHEINVSEPRHLGASPDNPLRVVFQNSQMGAHYLLRVWNPYRRHLRFDGLHFPGAYVPTTASWMEVSITGVSDGLYVTQVRHGDV